MNGGAVLAARLTAEDREIYTRSGMGVRIEALYRFADCSDYQRSGFRLKARGSIVKAVAGYENYLRSVEAAP